MISPSIFSLATAAASANLAARMWLTQGLTRELARGQVVYALIIFTCCVAALALSVWAHADAQFRAVNQQLGELTDRLDSDAKKADAKV
jgi:hypothetical protein